LGEVPRCVQLERISLLDSAPSRARPTARATRSSLPKTGYRAPCSRRRLVRRLLAAKLWSKDWAAIEGASSEALLGRDILKRIVKLLREPSL